MSCPHHPDVELGLERCARCNVSFCPDCLVWLRRQHLCAACKFDFVRGLLSGIVPGALDIASLGRRFAGMFLDNMITTMAAYAVMIPLVMLAAVAPIAGGKDSPGAIWPLLLIYPIVLGLPLLYEGLMLQRRGQTLGKMALGTKVVTPDGHDISAGQAWGRAALKLILGGCLAIGYLPALFTRERTSLHDLIARTRVVRVR